jgi:hypothetical protein
MALFACPHCDDVIELLGAFRPDEVPQCECGAVMEPAEAYREVEPPMPAHSGASPLRACGQ